MHTKQMGVYMNTKMKPLPVRFDPEVMEKCKMLSARSGSGFTASEIAREAMDTGLEILTDWIVKKEKSIK